MAMHDALVSPQAGFEVALSRPWGNRFASRRTDSPVRHAKGKHTRIRHVPTSLTSAARVFRGGRPIAMSWGISRLLLESGADPNLGDHIGPGIRVRAPRFTVARTSVHLTDVTLVTLVTLVRPLWFVWS